MRPRTVVFAMLAVIVLVAVAVTVSILLQESRPGQVELAEFSRDTMATVMLAGMFPGAEQPPLANPIGIAWDGEFLYVAESDAGVVRIFDAEGGDAGVIVIPSASSVASAYPSVVAVADGRIVVVDNAADRAVVVDAEPATPATITLTLGSSGQAPGQPTAVTYAEGEFFVADAADGTVKVYDTGGAYTRVLGADAKAPMGFSAGLAVTAEGLVVTDPGAGRLIVLDPDSGERVVLHEGLHMTPRSIAALGDGRMAVLDALALRVAIVDADGMIVDSIDEVSVPSGGLVSPRGMAWVPEDSRLYITDAGTGRVMVYGIREAR
ncbi:NHL repeat-containing protein [Anaerosoma tenue]|uniref:NHL repeat-containing protein n=1 Tax=Anaerosoma tenue TaxID=2933588 RepID=UPI002260ACCB|nr:NHL repeat-containing protein [Anaerosoma tenue]MCK8114673.1 NHL repeat-containing protein [Anaerosoma tenue]